MQTPSVPPAHSAIVAHGLPIVPLPIPAGAHSLTLSSSMSTHPYPVRQSTCVAQSSRQNPEPFPEKPQCAPVGHWVLSVQGCVVQ